MPSGRERKPAFSTIPPAFLARITKFLGDEIVHSEICAGGFSASAGFILSLSSGRRIFAKGSHPDEMAHGTQNLRQEIFVYEHIPVLRDIAPAYLGCLAEDDEDGWMLGFWEYIPQATAPVDWCGLYMQVGCFLRATENISCLKPALTQNYIASFFSTEKKWRRLMLEPATAEKFCSLFMDPLAARQWLNDNLDRLLVLQDRLPELLRGPVGMIHGDLRLDNILFGSRVRIIDWPNACQGPAVFDLLFLFASLESLGHGKIEKHLGDFAAVTGLSFSLQDCLVMAAGLAGFLAEQAFRAVPEKMPRLRWMQKSLLLALLFFLARQGVIGLPPRLCGQNTE